MPDAPLMLSVSGLRGLVGQSITPPVASQYAAAYGHWIKTQLHNHEEKPPHIVVGRDSRPSGQMFEMAVISGLISVGCRVTTVGIATTPGVAVMVGHLGADGGMVITASHNPIVWNGIKALTKDGVAPPPRQAQAIIDSFKNNNIQYVSVDHLVQMESPTSADRVHISRILNNIDTQAIRKKKLKVVLDSVRGAGGPSTALLLHELGVDLIHQYPETTGLFPHPPEPSRENLSGLCEAVRQHRADIGFAQDPDADRLAIVDEKGVYVGEEYTLALAAMHMLKKPQTPKGSIVVANLSTSRMIDDIASQNGAQVVRTPVGEANVAAEMRSRKAIIGGEGNGGVIWPKTIYVRDSLSGIALILELLSQHNESLSEIAKSIAPYSIVKDKFNVTPGVVDRIAPTFKKHFKDQRVDFQDGARVDWPDRWIHVRPSNTEPIIRMIAEAHNAEIASAMISDVRVLLNS